METAIWIGITLLQALIFGSIFRKAGYSGWMGLLMAVPLVNLATLLWFATTTWPLEMGYNTTTKQTNMDSAWELKMVLRRATTLEKTGQFPEAVKQLEEYASKIGESDANTVMLKERIAGLKSKGGLA